MKEGAMRRMKYKLVYADAEGVAHESTYTGYFRTINAGFRGAVRWATARGETPPGWDLIKVEWMEAL